MSHPPPYVAGHTLYEERREHRRQLYDTEATIIHPRLGELDGRTRDRSTNGIFMVLAEALDMQVGDIVQIRIRQLHMRMRIVRIEDDGVALKVVLDQTSP